MGKRFKRQMMGVSGAAAPLQSPLGKSVGAQHAAPAEINL